MVFHLDPSACYWGGNFLHFSVKTEGGFGKKSLSTIIGKFRFWYPLCIWFTAHSVLYQYNVNTVYVNTPMRVTHNPQCTLYKARLGMYNIY